MREKLQQWIRYHAIKHWYEKYERLLIPGMLLFGVVTDALAFTAIEISLAFVWLGTYILLSAVMIIFLQAYDAGHISKTSNSLRYLRLAAPLIIQFTFGALLNASFVFYLFSGTLSVSWPFFFILILLMVSNDVFRHYYLRPVVQVSVYFFLLFSFSSIFLPFALNQIGTTIFIASGAGSVVIITAYILILGRIVPDIRRHRRQMAMAIGTIFVLLNALYFFHITPPIPLALRDVAVAHDIQKVGGGYRLRVEQLSWRDRIFGPTFHADSTGRIAVYTSIFAPEHFATVIVHHWEQYDSLQKRWVLRDQIAYNIIGGTKTGYRGYTLKTHITAGEWRVAVETREGQVLGRVRFRVVPSETSVPTNIIEK